MCRELITSYSAKTVFFSLMDLHCKCTQEVHKGTASWHCRDCLCSCHGAMHAISQFVLKLNLYDHLLFLSCLVMV